MRSLSARLLLSFLILLVPSVVLAHNVTISGTNSFAALDGSSSDHDGVANGVFTVSDGDLIITGTVNCNDDTTTSACSMAFNASGDIVVSGSLFAENRSGGGTGGAITLSAGRDVVLSGSALVSSSSRSSSGAMGGNITATAGRNVSLASGTTIDAGSANAAGGSINVTAQGTVSIDGNVLSGPSRTILATRLTGAALDGGTNNQSGGEIHITSSTFAEPAVVVGSNANIVSQGETNGAGPVTIDGCGIQVKGLVAALARKDATAKVSIRSGKDLVVDARDLGVTGATLGRLGRVRADAPTGTAVNHTLELFARETIDVLGPAAASSSLFPLTAIAGVNDSKSVGGFVHVVSTEDAVNASGNVIDDGRSSSGDSGGPVEIAAKGNVNLDTAVIRSFGDTSTNNNARGGGSIAVRSYSGNVVWTNGVGDVRPTGSASGLAPADQGTITLTACGSVTTTGSSFPVNGSPTGVFPVITIGACSPAAPSLPAGVVLVTCNTPPVANDATATTNEDTSVTVTMTGSDADGDCLTFSVVSGPSNGSVGAVTFVNCTTSTVQYSPSANFNGSDSFVFQASDGNGGTDNGTATITVVPVNDPPSFQAGPSVTSLEDAGAQSYPNWATSISAGPTVDETSTQTVTFIVTNDNNALFSVQPAVSSTGTLTYTAAPNAYGSATITVVAQDSGSNVPPNSNTSASQTSTITVTPVNDPPSFTKGADQTVAEDSGAQTVSGWATAISPGPNESGQTVTFFTSNDNNALFSAQPAVSPSGTLTYTPAANANGTATVTIYAQDNGGVLNGGVDTSASQTFTITVTAVNDAPSFTGGGDVTVLEDSAAYSAAWASSISAGPADESGQTVTFGVTNNNNALFSAQPAISSSGVLTFTVAANAFGSATVTVTATDDGVPPASSAPQTFTINVTPVNDAPSFTGGGNVTVNEDSGAYSATWATAISAGPNEGGQTLTFNVSNDNTSLFTVQPSISPSGVLTFTLAANANGLANVTVTLSDDGGNANGGVDTSTPQSFTITVNAVNDPPSFTKGPDVSVLEDSGAASFPGWATAISAGPPDESGQTVTFIVNATNPSLFSSFPVVNSNGDLSFTVAPDAFGTSTVTITAQDNGTPSASSAPQTFTITVTGVNDAPSFTSGGNVTVAEDSGAYSAAWATGISAGPNEGGQTLTFNVANDNNALFSSQPAISASGVLMFTPAPNANGTATVTVSLSDNGGIANGGVDTSGTVTFTITVTPVNDAPVAGSDAYDTIGNTQLQVAASQTVAAPAVFVTGSVLSNDTDIDSPPGSLTASLVSSTAGAVVTVNADGTFTYLPPAGHPSATDSFTYSVSDGAASSNGTVTITLKGRVWYVKNNGGAGSGRSTDSFLTLAAAQAASVANDTIFVYTGDGTVLNQNAGFAMKNGQRLLGQGVALTVPVSVNGGPNPTVLLAAGTKPKISNAGGNGVTASAVSNVTIAGLEVTGALNNGINLASASNVTVDTVAVNGNLDNGIAGTTVSGFSLTNSSLTGNGDNAVLNESGINFVNLTGSATFSGSSVANSVSDNVRIFNTTGTLNRATFTSFTFGLNNAATGNDSLALSVSGVATLNATVQNCTFTGARGDVFQYTGGSGSTGDLVFENNAVSNSHPAIVSAGGGFAVASAGTLTYSIKNNTFRDALGSAVLVNSTGAGGVLTGRIETNQIGVTTVANSGSKQGSGIDVESNGGGDHSVTVTGNTVRWYNNHGILLQAGDQQGNAVTFEVSVTSNTVTQPGTLSTNFNGVHLNNGTVGGDNFTSCINISGNSLAGSGTGATSPNNNDIRLRERILTTVRLPGYAGANNNNAAVQLFMLANNTALTANAANTVSTGGGGYIGGAACTTP